MSKPRKVQPASITYISTGDGRGGRGRPMNCSDCGTEVIRRSPSQRYCASCSGVRDTARKAAWGAKNPHSAPRPYPEIKSAIVAAGEERSLASRQKTYWDADEPVDYRLLRRVAVPFDYAASKNAVWRRGRGGHVFARQESVALRSLLADAIRSSGDSWFQGKVWIDVFVEKPDHKGDAVNVVDLVCDAVKDAIGVDDRWYSIRRLDWSIVKRDPMLIVGVSQAVVEDHQVCSHCGVAYPLASSFGKNRSTKTGYSRVCRLCSAPKRAMRAVA